MNNSNQQPIFAPFFNLIVMQALLQAQLQSGTPMMEPPHVLPTMAQRQQEQHRASTSSPSQNRRSGRRRKTVAREPYHIILASSGTIVPPASFRALLGWMPTTQELAGFTVPRRGTRPWSTATQANGKGRNLTTGIVQVRVGLSVIGTS